MFRRLMPDVGAPAMRLMTCLYTRTPDGHFLMDRSPDHARIVLASPCTGHGFKFASLFGKVLPDMRSATCCRKTWRCSVSPGSPERKRTADTLARFLVTSVLS